MVGLLLKCNGHGVLIHSTNRLIVETLHIYKLECVLTGSYHWMLWAKGHCSLCKAESN